MNAVFIYGKLLLFHHEQISGVISVGCRNNLTVGILEYINPHVDIFNIRAWRISESLDIVYNIK